MKCCCSYNCSNCKDIYHCVQWSQGCAACKDWCHHHGRVLDVSRWLLLLSEVKTCDVVLRTTVTDDQRKSDISAVWPVIQRCGPGLCLVCVLSRAGNSFTYVEGHNLDPFVSTYSNLYSDTFNLVEPSKKYARRDLSSWSSRGALGYERILTSCISFFLWMELSAMKHGDVRLFIWFTMTKKFDCAGRQRLKRASAQ